MLEANQWHAIPGTANACLFPLLRKPSISCSNAFIMQTPERIVILDPGADEAQIEHIEHITAQLLREKARPVSIYLTHTHVDHFLEVPRLLGEPLRGRLICHVNGADVLRRQDEELTMANLSARPVPVCTVRERLFETIRDLDKSETRPLVPNGTAGRLKVTRDHSLCMQTVDIGGGDLMEAFHTPGHTADGVSYRVGNYLFPGDLPFATDVAVAGVAGWDPAELADSYNTLRWIIRNREVTHVLPGHGTFFPLKRAERIFARSESELKRLTDIVPLDKARMARLQEYAQAILDEVGTIFAIIGARLLKAAHYLELLEEEEAAGSILASIDFEAIDAVIGDFHSFVEKFKNNEDKSIILLKAVQFVRKLNATFAPEKISRIIDRSLLRRVASLFDDFINAVHGIRFGNQEVAFDLNAAVETLLLSLKEAPFDERAIFETLDCEERFVGELAARFAYHPVFEHVSFDFIPADVEVLATMEKEVFEDTVTSFLEELAALGAEKIRIECKPAGSKAVLIIHPASMRDRTDAGGSKERYIRLALGNYGCDFRRVSEGNSNAYLFELPVAATPQ